MTKHYVLSLDQASKLLKNHGYMGFEQRFDAYGEKSNSGPDVQLNLGDQSGYISIGWGYSYGKSLGGFGIDFLIKKTGDIFITRGPSFTGDEQIIKEIIHDVTTLNTNECS